MSVHSIIFISILLLCAVTDLVCAITLIIRKRRQRKAKEEWREQMEWDYMAHMDIRD